MKYIVYPMQVKTGESGFVYADFLVKKYPRYYKKHINQDENLIFISAKKENTNQYYKIQSLKSNIYKLNPDETTPALHKTTNSFSYYKNGNFSSFFPVMIHRFKEKIALDCSKNIIGFYNRENQLTISDAANKAVKFCNDNNFKVVLLGEDSRQFKNKVLHTTDSDLFFKSISHFYYPRQSTAEAYPTTLVEAIQAGCQIISTQKRNFEDGVDDVLSCCKYTIDELGCLNNDNSILMSEKIEKINEIIIEQENMFKPNVQEMDFNAFLREYTK